MKPLLQLFYYIHLLKVSFSGDVEITDLEAGEVIIYSNDTTNTTLPQLLLSYPCLLQPSLNASTEGNEKGRKSKSNKYPFEEHQKFSEEIENDYIIVVEGLLKANDISDKTNSASLLEIMNTSYLLNESAIDCFLEFENLEVGMLRNFFSNKFHKIFLLPSKFLNC